jgi:hypothetical protein
MDKWDEITHRIQQSLLAEEPEAAVSAGLQLFAEFGRTLEMISADMDRIATVLEKAFEPGIQHAEPVVHDL